MSEEASKSTMAVLPNGLGDRRQNESALWDEGDETSQFHPIENGFLPVGVNQGMEASFRTPPVDDGPKRALEQKSKAKNNNDASPQNSEFFANSPVKKSTSHATSASPHLQIGPQIKEESPTKTRERDEKIRLARERKREEQKKREEELRESIARSEEVRKRQEEERKRKLEEQRRREEEHRSLVEERRRRLWDEEIERRQAIIKKNAQRLDFKKSYKTGSMSPAKSRAQSVGNVRRKRPDAGSGVAAKPAVPQSEKGYPAHSKVAAKPREKTPARTGRQSVPASTSTSSRQEQAAFDRLRSRRSKTPVVARNANELPRTTNGHGAVALNDPADGLMAKSMEDDRSTEVKNLPKKMRSSWAPSGNKEKDKQEKPNKPTPQQPTTKAVPKKVPIVPQKSSVLTEKGTKEESKLSPDDGRESQVAASTAAISVKKQDAAKEAVEVVATTATAMTSEVAAAAGPPKKSSQMEEHQRKLAENRRLAREKAEREAEEERIRLEKLKQEEEDRLKREAEEARRQEEEELRLLEAAKKAEQERYLKAVEEENERKKKEEERMEIERKEKLEAELRAKEELEKREREREEKMKKMAEEKEERKKKLEMIMKRVKTDEPTSKIEPTKSPPSESETTPTLPSPQISSQPMSTVLEASRPAMPLPLENISIRNEADSASSFKSPLLQKMLGGKIKGVGKPASTSATIAEEVDATENQGSEESTESSADRNLAIPPSGDVCLPEETSQEDVHVVLMESNISEGSSYLKPCSTPPQLADLEISPVDSLTVLSDQRPDLSEARDDPVSPVLSPDADYTRPTNLDILNMPSPPEKEESSENLITAADPTHVDPLESLVEELVSLSAEEKVEESSEELEGSNSDEESSISNPKSPSVLEHLQIAVSYPPHDDSAEGRAGVAENELGNKEPSLIQDLCLEPITAIHLEKVDSDVMHVSPTDLPEKIPVDVKEVTFDSLDFSVDRDDSSKPKAGEDNLLNEEVDDKMKEPDDAVEINVHPVNNEVSEYEEETSSKEILPSLEYHPPSHPDANVKVESMYSTDVVSCDEINNRTSGFSDVADLLDIVPLEKSKQISSDEEDVDEEFSDDDSEHSQKLTVRTRMPPESIEKSNISVNRDGGADIFERLIDFDLNDEVSDRKQNGSKINEVDVSNNVPGHFGSWNATMDGDDLPEIFAAMSVSTDDPGSDGLSKNFGIPSAAVE